MSTPRGPIDSMADAVALLDQRARALARPVEANASAGSALHVVVRVGAHRIAVRADRAQRCSMPEPVARLPGDGVGALVGVVGAAGGVVPVADLAELLDVAAAVPIAQRPMLIIDDAGEGLALLVDELVSLVTVEDALAADPDALTSAAGHDIRVLHVDALLDAVGTVASPPIPARPGASS